MGRLEKKLGLSKRDCDEPNDQRYQTLKETNHLFDWDGFKSCADEC